MPADGNKTIVRQLTEAWNQGNNQLLDDLLATDYRHHAPLLPNASREEYMQWFHDTRSAFPDLLITMDDLMAEGDQVAVRWTFQGTHQGALITPMGAVPPTGKRVTVSGITLFHIRDGKLNEDWQVGDDFGFMQQLGLLPQSEQAAAASTS